MLLLAGRGVPAMPLYWPHIEAFSKLFFKVVVSIYISPVFLLKTSYSSLTGRWGFHLVYRVTMMRNGEESLRFIYQINIIKHLPNSGTVESSKADLELTIHTFVAFPLHSYDCKCPAHCLCWLLHRQKRPVSVLCTDWSPVGVKSTK